MIKLFTKKEDNLEYEEDFYEENNENYEEEEIDDTDAKGQIALDILADEKYITIIAPVAGIDMNDIDIQISDNTLTIKGKRVKPAELYHEEAEEKISECFWGKFLRNVVLPENLDFSKIKAIMENNLLVIRIPKIHYNTKSVHIDRVEDIS